jgi:hypothetical protein
VLSAGENQASTLPHEGKDNVESLFIFYWIAIPESLYVICKRTRCLCAGIESPFISAMLPQLTDKPEWCIKIPTGRYFLFYFRERPEGFFLKTRFIRQTFGTMLDQKE